MRDLSFCFLRHPAAVESHAARFRAPSRSTTARGNTRSVSRAPLVPSRFYWSIKTRPTPPPWFYPSLLRTTSSRVSRRQRQHLPLSSPLSPPRSTVVPHDPPPGGGGGGVATAVSAALHFSSTVDVLIFPSLQVTKASSTKSGPAAITSAANQTASVTGAKHSWLNNSCMDFEMTKQDRQTDGLLY